MYLIDSFDTKMLADCRQAVHGLAEDASDMETVAQRITDHLYGAFRSASGEPASALVRFYKTHRFGKLPEDLQSYVRGRFESETLAANSPCLTLLGTSGRLPEWNDTRLSAGHRAILLGNLDAVPMIAALIRDLGIDERILLDPPAVVHVDTHLRQYNLFHVAEAAGSAAVPAQDFVAEHGIRSVVGFGGLLASGDMFGVIIFTVVPVASDALPNFRTLASTIKTTVVPHTYDVFDLSRHDAPA